jgi:hypothetical protein
MNNLLPYAFARDYGVLARSNGDPAQAVEVMVSNATKPAAIAEISRRFGRIALRRMEPVPPPTRAPAATLRRSPTSSTPTST